MADMGTVATVREYLKANKNRIPYHCKHTLSHSWLLKCEPFHGSRTRCR